MGQMFRRKKKEHKSKLLSPDIFRWGRRLPREVVGAKNRGRKKTNKHKQLCGIVPEMGGGSNCLCVPFFMGKRETHKQNSQEISGKGRESPGTVPG